MNVIILIIEIAILILGYITLKLTHTSITDFKIILIAFGGLTLEILRRFMELIKKEKDAKKSKEHHKDTNDIPARVVEELQKQGLLPLPSKEEVKQELSAVKKEMLQEVEEAEAEYNKGEEYYKQFKFEQAAGHFQRAASKVSIPSFYLSLGNSQYYLAQYDSALKNLESALKLAQEKGNKKLEGTTLNNIGGIYRAWGKYDQAIDYYNQSLKIRREIGDIAGEAVTKNNMAVIYAGQGKLKQAIELMEQVVKIERDIKHPDYEKDLAYLNQLREKRH